MDLNEPPRMSRRRPLIRSIAIFMADPERTPENSHAAHAVQKIDFCNIASVRIESGSPVLPAFGR